MVGRGILEACGWAEAGMAWEMWVYVRGGREGVNSVGMCHSILEVEGCGGWWWVVSREAAYGMEHIGGWLGWQNGVEAAWCGEIRSSLSKGAM